MLDFDLSILWVPVLGIILFLIINKVIAKISNGRGRAFRRGKSVTLEKNIDQSELSKQDVIVEMETLLSRVIAGGGFLVLSLLGDGYIQFSLSKEGGGTCEAASEKYLDSSLLPDSKKTALKTLGFLEPNHSRTDNYYFDFDYGEEFTCRSLAEFSYRILSEIYDMKRNDLIEVIAEMGKLES